MVWGTHVTLDASDEAVRGVSICLDKRAVLKQFTTDDLREELARRPGFNFAEHATDEQITDEAKDRGLSTNEDIGDIDTQDIQEEMRSRGYSCVLVGWGDNSYFASAVNRLEHGLSVSGTIAIDDIRLLVENLSERQFVVVKKGVKLNV